MKDSGGAILIGLVGIGAGALIVNYAFAAPGESWFDEMGRWFGRGKYPEGAGPAGLPPGPHPSAGPGAYAQLPEAVPFQGPPPASPDIVREVQARLNSFGLPGLAGVSFPLTVDGILGHGTRAVIAAMQQQWNLPVTAYPDASTLATLRSMTGPVGQTPRVPMQAPRVPMQAPSVPMQHPPHAGPAHGGGAAPGVGEVLARLGQFFHLNLSRGPVAADDITHLITRFQAQMGLRPTGAADAQTVAQLRQATGASHVTGAADWESETGALGPAAQDVIRHAISSESDKRTLASLSSALGAAGYPLAAAAVKSGQGVTATSGWW